jgi:hypothetical protein
LPVLLDERKTARQELITGTKPTHMAVRQGQFKYIPSLGSGGFSNPRRVQPVPKGPRGQLYNLSEDIGEAKNLWLDEPGLVESFEKQIAKQKVSGRTRPPMKLFNKLLSESPQITTHRLNAEPNDKRFLYYTVSRDGRTLRGKTAGRLRSLLISDADSTTRHDEKSHFDPGILLRFRLGDHEAQVAICFICNKWALYLNGETVSYTSLADDRAAVLAEVKMMFPKDKIIQGIPEKLQ